MASILRSRLWMLAAAFLFVAASASADIHFQPRIDNSRLVSGGGECTIRLLVDGEVNVVVHPNDIYVRTISGREARDLGSECTSPMPTNMANVNFNRGQGRGEVELMSGPGERGDALVVRISDRRAGDAPYSFRLSWQGSYDNGRPGWQSGYYNGEPGSMTGRGSGYLPPEAEEQAINTCQNAAAARIRNNFGARNLRFHDTHIADRDGDLIVGEATGNRLIFSSDFRFRCHMDRNLDSVVSVDVNRENR